MGFALLLLAVITVFSSMLVGSFLPLMQQQGTQPVILVSKAPEKPKSNLQLYSLNAITLTPTPAARIFPQPQEKGGFNYGTPPDGDGSSAPSGGGGGGSGGGAAI